MPLYNSCIISTNETQDNTVLISEEREENPIGDTSFQKQWADSWGIPEELKPWEGPDAVYETGDLKPPSHEMIQEGRLIPEGSLEDALSILNHGDILGIGHWLRFDLNPDGSPGFLKHVLDTLRRMGKKGIILSMALIYDAGHDVVFDAISDGTLSSIKCGGAYGKLARRVSAGELLEPCGVLEFIGYGGRSVRMAKDDPSLRAKVFLAPVSAVDRMGRTSGVIGDAGSLSGTSHGFTFLEGRHAEKYVVVADSIFDSFNQNGNGLPGGTFDAFAPEMIVDARKHGIPISNFGIEAGTTKAKSGSPFDTMGDNAAKAITHLLQDGGIQFGAGGGVAALIDRIRLILQKHSTVLSSIVGGHNKGTLDIFDDEGAKSLFAAQCFTTSDCRLFAGIVDGNITPLNTWDLLSSFNTDHHYQRQTVAVLGATMVGPEGVNFMTDSYGDLMAGQGGALDSATSEATVYALPLVRRRRNGDIIPGIVHALPTVCVPSDHVTAVVTDEPGLVAINTNSISRHRDSIRKQALLQGLRVVTLQELADIALERSESLKRENGGNIILPERKTTGSVVAHNYWRDGESVIGVMRQT